MDREAAVIRAEMSRTRADLDRKLTLLEARARDLSPRRYARERIPDHFLDRALGSALTMAGLIMAWSAWRRRRARRVHEVHDALVAYGRW